MIEIFNFKSEGEIKEKCQHISSVSWEIDIGETEYIYFIFCYKHNENIFYSNWEEELLWSQQKQKVYHKIFWFSYRWIFTLDIEQVAWQKLVWKKFSTHQEYFRSKNKNP